MNLLLPYIISWGLGYFIIKVVLKPGPRIYPILFNCLSLLIGLGVSSLLTFISFLVSDEYNRLVILYLNLLVFIVFFILRVWQTKDKIKIFSLNLATPLKDINWIKTPEVYFSLIWIALIYIIYGLAKGHPYGEWDAWAVWNMKAKFLILSGNAWRDIFHQMHWHTQPDYPLLLPLINVWSYAVTKASLHKIAFTTCLVFTITCCLLLYAGLSQFTHKGVAFIMSTLLFLHPYYIYTATAQYADILFATYLLSIIITLCLTLQSQLPNMGSLCGFLLGLLTFLKNEGIVIAVLLTIIFIGAILLDKTLKKAQRAQLITRFLAGLFIASMSTLILKFCLAPPNRDILPDFSILTTKLINVKRLTLIKSFIINEMLDKRWHGVWLLILGLSLYGAPKLFRKEFAGVSCFFFFYFCTVTFIYLITINFDLAWRLSRTLQRIYFYQLPSILFFCTYINWGKQKGNG